MGGGGGGGHVLGGSERLVRLNTTWPGLDEIIITFFTNVYTDIHNMLQDNIRDWYEEQDVVPINTPAHPL